MELPIQAKCFQWHWNTYPNERQTLFHVQNKAKNAIEGSKFKAMGVVKGVSDFVLLLYKEVVFIEMKEDGDQKPEQLSFQLKVEARGHRYFICRSFDEFKELIISLYYVPEI